MPKDDSINFGVPAIRPQRGSRMQYIGPAGPSSERYCHFHRRRSREVAHVMARFGGESFWKSDVSDAVALTFGARPTKGVKRGVLRLRPTVLPGTRGLDRPASWVAPPTDTMEFAGYPCHYCGRPAEAIDHVWPRSRGGDDHPNNLVRSCRPCNAIKGSKSLLMSRCAGCGTKRDPGDVDTSIGRAFYACRCGQSWTLDWDLQLVRL